MILFWGGLVEGKQTAAQAVCPVRMDGEKLRMAELRDGMCRMMLSHLNIDVWIICGFWKAIRGCALWV